MKIELIPEAGRFYKANLHCHTTLSDGTQTPEEVKEYYKKNGYSAVCFTDHEVLLDQSALCDEEFIALHGYEIAIKQDLNSHTGLFMPVYHFNLIAERQDQLTMPRFFLNNPSIPGNAREWLERKGQYDENDTVSTVKYDKEWLNEYLCAIRDAGFLITYNHPQWSLQGPSDYAGLKGLHAMEVINGCCAGLNDNTSIHYEQMLRSGVNACAIGGDDNHRLSGCGLGWTMIKAPELTYDALIAAYKKGDCYASEGPEIRGLTIEDGEIVVKTSAVAGISVFAESRACYVKALPRHAGPEDTPLTEAHFPYTPEKFGRYFRVEIRDLRGYRAFSRAYLVSEIEASR